MTLVFEDNFDGTTINGSKWPNVYTNPTWWPNTSADSANASVSKSAMRMLSNLTWDGPVVGRPSQHAVTQGEWRIRFVALCRYCFARFDLKLFSVAGTGFVSDRENGDRPPASALTRSRLGQPPFAGNPVELNSLSDPSCVSRAKRLCAQRQYLRSYASGVETGDYALHCHVASLRVACRVGYYPHSHIGYSARGCAIQ